MFGIGNLDKELKFISGNIMNMIIFDKFKTGTPLLDAFITTIVLSIFTYLLQSLNDNFFKLINWIKLFEFNIFYKKHIVEYDGKISLSTTYYESELNQSHSFSDRFRALWIYIIENTNENNTIRHIKEYSFGNASYNKNRDLGIYMVAQNEQFTISKELEIYAYTTILNEDQDNDKQNSKDRNSKQINRIEKVTIKLFSYKSDINIIKSFVENITKKYLASIEDSRDNKRYIYTLTKSKYEDNKYELWDENIFSSTRKFTNIFFKNKEILMQKIDFFMNNKEWYFEKGIPYSIGIGMYGPPGTGKTSLIKSIANYTDRHIVVISLKLIKTKKQLDSIFFEERYNVDNKKNSIGFDKKIIVFEDIDCIGDIVLNREKLKNKQVPGFENKLENENISCNTKINVGDILETLISADNANKNNYQIPKLLLDDEPITLDDILNLWDGIRETPGRIMIISSNHYHELDPALVRPGRIDVTLELSNISHEILKEMYSHLFNETIHDEAIKNIEEHFYSPAEVINIYMNENRDKERFIQRLMKNEHV